MALFTIAKDDSGSTLEYIKEDDLAGLIHYCCDKCIYMEWHNLFPIGTDGFIDQMLYLQKFRGKSLSTRAIHYILSVEYDELSKGKWIEEMKSITRMINIYFFGEYQHICCLHGDKPGKYDIHIIINPVNIYKYNLYHCSIPKFKGMLRELARYLYDYQQLELMNVSYLDRNNRLRFE